MFEFSMSKKDLVNFFDNAKSKIRGGTLPVTHCFLLEANEKTITITRNNTEDFRIERVAVPSLKGSGAAVIDVNSILKLVKAAPDSLLDIKIDDKEAIVSFGAGKSLKLRTASSSKDFPRPDLAKPTILGIFSKKDLDGMIKATRHAMSEDYTKPNLCGILLALIGSGANKKFRAVATDGCRLAYKMVETKSRPSDLNKNGALLSKIAANEIVDTQAADDAEIKIMVKEIGKSGYSQYVFTKIGNVTIGCATVEGPFPQYDKVIPKDFDLICDIPIDQLAPALKRIIAGGRRDAPAAMLTFNTEKGVSIKTEERLRNPIFAVEETIDKAKIKRDFRGESFIFADSGFLAEATKLAKGTVSLKMRDHLSPFMIEYGPRGDKAFEVIMPINMDREKQKAA